MVKILIIILFSALEVSKLSWWFVQIEH